MPFAPAKNVRTADHIEPYIADSGRLRRTARRLSRRETKLWNLADADFHPCSAQPFDPVHLEPAIGMLIDERATLLALADDVPRLWNHPAASAETRKRILRTILNEIIVTVEPDRLRLMLHWQGGDHTRLEVVKNRSGQHRWKTDTATEQLIRELARILPDQSIASVLNRLGVRSAKGHTWTQLRVRT